ncbi:aminopeptidase [Streptomyces sp. NBC_01808]|uniref:aminopeptidase n=1 Tax=Streptomyces sp. NBC_01808 TaxID=2975947 RepID=UPI002DDC0191|nr:aminopeptidase [Streptomyces sp. NBC_01808]WSA40600.1 aminopeptidase [Streptomyces sp. NBC_01808]
MDPSAHASPASRYRLQRDDLVRWTVIGCPTRAWARAVFGEDDVSRLRGHLKHFLRLDRPDPAAAWRERLAELKARAVRLDGLGLDAVHFEGPGTDLTIGLIPGGRWDAVGFDSADGRRFVANLPSEEVYTTPDHRRVEGTVRATRPLALAGTVVTGLELTFTAGRVSEVRASSGADVVRAHQAADRGGARARPWAYGRFRGGLRALRCTARPAARRRAGTRSAPRGSGGAW